MKYEEYLEQVNKTWKNDTDFKELRHCLLAIPEEVGEVFGWYKKHYGYGKAKDTKWRAGIVGEFGDIMYYLSKLSEISGYGEEVEVYFEETFTIDTIPHDNYNALSEVLDDMWRAASVLRESSTSSFIFRNALVEMFEQLHQLIILEGFDFEDVQFKNLAKLQERHGDKFNNKSIMEEGRDRQAEDKALGDAE